MRETAAGNQRREVTAGDCKETAGDRKETAGDRKETAGDRKETGFPSPG